MKEKGYAGLWGIWWCGWGGEGETPGVVVDSVGLAEARYQLLLMVLVVVLLEVWFSG